MPDEFDCCYTEMDEEDYNNSILANSCMYANFDDWFGDKNAKILVIGITESTVIHILNQK